MLKYLRLPVTFDTARLQQEVQALAAGNWKAHYNTKHYEGDWSILPLRSINGDVNNNYSVHATASDSHYQDTPLLKTCSYLQTVLAQFNCPKTSVRLMKLDSGAIIKEHTDYDMYYEAGEARIHIPVFTNPQVEFYIQQERVMMNEGECWYLNLNLPHRVSNPGTQDRIHLVIDLLVNDWVKEQFTAPDLYKKEINEEEALRKPSPAQQAQIIAELERSGTPEALQLAAQLRSTLHINT